MIKRSLLILLILSWGCSSLPEPQDQQPKEVSDGYVMFKTATRLLSENRNNAALENAKRAHLLFSLADDEKGLALSSLFLAKLLKNQEPKQAGKFANQAKDLITTFRPDLWPHYHLHQVERLFAEANYADVLAYLNSVRQKNDDPYFQTSFLAYWLMSAIKLNRDASDDEFKDALQTLSDLAIDLEEDYQEMNSHDPLTVSFAMYVCGLGESYLKHWPKAQAWYLKARTIDQQLSHFKGTADNLYGLGQCALNLKEFPKAKSYFLRSSRIYESLNDSLSAKEAKTQALNCEKLLAAEK